MRQLTLGIDNLHSIQIVDLTLISAFVFLWLWNSLVEETLIYPFIHSVVFIRPGTFIWHLLYAWHCGVPSRVFKDVSDCPQGPSSRKGRSNEAWYSFRVI